jgi:hypothetical protein
VEIELICEEGADTTDPVNRIASFAEYISVIGERIEDSYLELVLREKEK